MMKSFRIAGALVLALGLFVVSSEAIDCRLIRCSSESIPVCGRDVSSGSTKTFTNQCQMESYNCQNTCTKFVLAYDGECRKKH